LISDKFLVFHPRISDILPKIPTKRILNPNRKTNKKHIMERILIIGATGQLGTRVFQKLAKTGRYQLRILIREDSVYDHLKSAEPEIFFGDLRDKDTVFPAVRESDIIISTANAAIPRKPTDTFLAVDVIGHRYLIDAAKEAGVKQFIYTSVNAPEGMDPDWIPIFRSKMKTEAYLKESGLNYSIFRPDAFMDVYFAFMGTDIPLRNEVAATVERPWGFMQNFFKGIKADIAHGKIDIVGDGTVKHSYVALEDVAEFIVKAIGEPEFSRATVKLGGPEALSALDLKAVFEKVLEKPLEVKQTPVFMTKMMGKLFSLFNPAISNIFKINYMGATWPTVFDTQKLAEKFSIKLTTAEAYLQNKMEAG
jgi:uncharacterized protein YbjT (DUF2867 family)